MPRAKKPAKTKKTSAVVGGTPAKRFRSFIVEDNLTPAQARVKAGLRKVHKGMLP